MSDLIKREDAIRELVRSSVYAWSVEQDQSAHNWAIGIINSLPTDEPQGELVSKVDAIKAVCRDCLREYEEDKCEHENECSMKKALVELPSAEAVGDAISKKFISDAILQKISELNAQGEKSIPIAREFIRFKRFVDGITPIRADADRPQGEWIDVENEPYCECSVCGAYIENLDDDYAFCPRCGADMRGDTE